MVTQQQFLSTGALDQQLLSQGWSQGTQEVLVGSPLGSLSFCLDLSPTLAFWNGHLIFLLLPQLAVAREEFAALDEERKPRTRAS